MQQPPDPYPQYPQQQSPMPPQQPYHDPQYPHRHVLLPDPEWYKIQGQEPPIPFDERPQQPQYPYYQRTEPQYAPPPEQPPAPPAQPPKKPGKVTIGSHIGGVAIALAVIVVLGVLVMVIAAIASAGGMSAQDTAATQTAQDVNRIATQAAQDVNTPVTQPTQAPTQSPAESEKAYKASATDTTVADLDKKGSSGQGDIVHFTATILDFVKDSSGNTGAANVSIDTTSSVVQVVFPENTDVTRLNENDTLEVWGIDAGVFSGTNAYGGTVQEVGVQAQYMTDQTTGYQAG